MADANLQVILSVVDKASKELEGFAGAVEKHRKAIGVAMVGTGAAITAMGILAVKQTADLGDQMQKMAIRTGFSTESLSELKYIADLGGTSIEGLEVATRKMTQSIVDAGSGMKTAQDDLKRLGLKYEDLKELAPEKQFALVTSRLADMTNKTEQVATAVGLFGRSGTELLPVLQGGSEEMERLRKEAADSGLIITQEAADSSAKFNDSLTTLKGSVGGLTMGLARDLMPILTDLIEKVTNTVKWIKGWAAEHPGLVKVIVIALAVLGPLLTILGSLLLILPGLITAIGLFGAALHLAMGPVGLIALAITALIAAGVLLWKNWDTIKEFAISIWNDIRDFLNETWEGIKAIWGTVTGFFSNIFEGIKNAISEHWDKILAILFPAVGIPVLIARHWEGITDFFKDIWEAITNIISEHWDKILAIIFPAVGIPILIARHWEGIMGFFSNLFEEIQNIASTLWDEIKAIPIEAWNNIKQAWQTATGFFASIWTGIKNVFREGVNFLIGLAEAFANTWIKAVNFVIDAFNKIQISIPDWVPGIGGKSFGINILPIPEITLPRLAKGGIVTKPTIAMLGEAGPEVIMPLRTKTEIPDVIERFVSIFKPVFPVLFSKESIPAFQYGGIVTKPTLALVGEKGPEIVMPLKQKATSININFNAPVYGLADFERKITQIVRDAALRGGFYGVTVGAK